MKTSFPFQLLLVLLCLTAAAPIAVAQSSYSTDTAYISSLLRQGEAIEAQDLPKAIGYYQKAHIAAKKAHFINGYFHTVRLLVFALNNNGKHADAKNIAQEAVERVQNDTSKYHHMVVQNALALTAHMTGDWKEAIGRYEQAAVYARQLGRRDNEAVVYNNIGSISSRQLLHQQSLAFHQKALAVYRTLPDNRRDVSSSLVNIGVVYAMQDQYNPSNSYYYQAKALLDSTRDQDMLIKLYNNLGNNYRNLKRYDSCHYFLSKALKLARQTHNAQEEFHLLTVLAEAYNFQYKPKEARRLLDQARAMLDTLKLGLPERQSLLIQEVNNAELRGDFKAAYNDYSIYIERRDSLVNNELREQVATYDERMRKAEAGEKIALLEATQQRQRTWLWIGGLTVLTLLMVGVLAWLYYQQRQRAAAAALLAAGQQQELAAIRAELAGQQKERMRISKEMHDDLGASLTAIGLLSEVVMTRVDVNRVPEVGKISQISASMVTAMNEIIWSLNTRNDSLNGLIAYMRAYAREFIDNTPLRLQLDISEADEEVTIRGSDRRNVFLTMKEALNNAVRHAQATTITLRIEPLKNPGSGGTLHIDVCDNGRGFDPDTLPRTVGNGLTNMHLRMQDSGGTCTLCSGPLGTCIDIRFPYENHANAVLN